MTFYRKSFIGIGTLFLVAALVYGYSVFFTVQESGETGIMAKSCVGGQKISCWLEEVTEALTSHGLAAAFDRVALLYESESAFAVECHSVTHELGKAAYEKFSRGDELDITTKTSYCGYGFYHGFMETLLQTSGDIREARQFCADVDAKLSRERLGAATACYHGMGHGTVDGSDPRTWGSAEKMIAPGIEICILVAETEFQEYLCATGIFNSIEVLARDKKYGISNLLENPFSLCHGRAALYREPCYTNMIPAVLALAGGDFSKAAQYIEDNIQHANDFTIDGYTIREMVILSLFHEFVRGNIDMVGYTKHGMELCRSLPEHSRLACVEGIADGHMKYGKPGLEYIKVLSFCSNELLHSDEKEICYKHILTRLPIWYSKDEQKDICKLVPMIYRKYCTI